MKTKLPLCPLWPPIGAGDAKGAIAGFLLSGVVLLSACVLLPLCAFVWADRHDSLDLDAAVGSEPVMKEVGPLAPVLVEVNARGWAFVSGKRVSPPALRDLVRRALRIWPEQPVVFQVAESAPTQHLEPFLTACLSSGVRHVHLIRLR